MLLDDGHPFHGNLHAQVSPGHHDAIDLGKYGVDVIDALGPLQLSHDQRFAAGGVQMFPGVEDVFGRAHEGQADPIDPVFDAELEGDLVPLG